MFSIIPKWNDEEYCRTILFHGLEEAQFYLPDSDIRIRSLVVVAIRNSLLEDAASTTSAALSLGLRRVSVSDEQIKLITSDAINFFSTYNLSVEALKLNEPDENLFIQLESIYPLAWSAMRHLSQCSNYMSFNNTNGSKTKSNIDINSTQSELFVEVQSGIDPKMNTVLVQILKRISDGQQPFFFSDSFKMITRNHDKLYKVLESVLASNVPVVTINYYISNGYVARRSDLLKPAHSEKDIREKLKISHGLRKIHLEIIKQIRQ
ncbi:hypothetical protein [Paenibacillus sp. YAF4_2]|uniref:hypothetical protein n=1 Tax=Paenibacillus sp. YAF4_2 TaxID=3233085 RepID=UPI003F9868C1